MCPRPFRDSGLLCPLDGHAPLLSSSHLRCSVERYVAGSWSTDRTCSNCTSWERETIPCKVPFATTGNWLTSLRAMSFRASRTGVSGVMKCHLECWSRHMVLDTSGSSDPVYGTRSFGVPQTRESKPSRVSQPEIDAGQRLPKIAYKLRMAPQSRYFPEFMPGSVRL